MLFWYCLLSLCPSVNLLARLIEPSCMNVHISQHVSLVTSRHVLVQQVILDMVADIAGNQWGRNLCSS